MSEEARKSSWRFERNKILQQMLENYKVARLFILAHIYKNELSYALSSLL